jgi:hypothetical protein
MYHAVKTHRVSINLPDGQYSQNGGETLKETFTAHFPDSRHINDSNNEQKQLNLNICRSRTNRGDWNLARNIIDQKSHGH